jgi:hypothetical protein
LASDSLSQKPVPAIAIAIRAIFRADEILASDRRLSRRAGHARMYQRSNHSALTFYDFAYNDENEIPEGSDK